MAPQAIFPILPLRRNLKALDRLKNSLARVGSFYGAKMFGALADDIDAPAGHQRKTLPTKLCCGGCSFQFGRASILFPRLPHLVQTT